MGRTGHSAHIYALMSILLVMHKESAGIRSLSCSVFGGISCVSAVYCILGGTRVAPPNPSVLFESWNGKAFTLMKAASPAEFVSAINGVSCVSAKTCTAIGTISGAAGHPYGQSFAVGSWNGRVWSVALAVSYHGRSWTRARVPALPKGGTSAFNGVSCMSATWCVAVGEGGGPGGQLFSGAALTAFWNGKS